jgi:hypothetical protein
VMYLSVLLSLFVPVVVIQIRFAYRRRQLQRQSWYAVLSRIQPVDVAGIRAVADCYLNPSQNQLRYEPNEMWMAIGELGGINRLKANAAAMIDLAVYAERWNQTEGPVISEMLRRDAVRLNRAVLRIQLMFLFQVGFLRAPFHIQEAASSYYLMRSRLLSLYENSHIGLLPGLTAAL